MALKQSIKQALRRVLRRDDNGWGKVHSFDRAHGTDTSGFMAREQLLGNTEVPSGAHPYAGSQPSMLRQVLATLPGLETNTFIDFGCGKGRPLFVASEFPFRAIVGVELSPRLSDIARENAAIIASHYPARTKVTVETCDANQYQLPEGDITIFLYNPFSLEGMKTLIAAVEAALKTSARCIYIIYYNPVSGALFDASPALTRRLARNFPYGQDEIGFGPDTMDAIIVWQGGTAPIPVERVDAKIVITVPDIRAELEGG